MMMITARHCDMLLCVDKTFLYTINNFVIYHLRNLYVIMPQLIVCPNIR